MWVSSIIHLNIFVQYVTSNFVFIVSPFLQGRIWIQLISQDRTVTSEILILKIEILIEFQNKTNVEITGF